MLIVGLARLCFWVLVVGSICFNLLIFLYVFYVGTLDYVLLFSRKQMDTSRLLKMFSIELLFTRNGSDIVGWILDEETSQVHFEACLSFEK